MKARKRVLVCCEESQAVCLAFRNLGHEAFSCDLLPCSGGHPEYHFQSDALEVLSSRTWDIVIAHPPCTYLSNAGSPWLYKGHHLNADRYSKLLRAREFFLKFLYSDASPMICVENPRPVRIANLPPPSQVISPSDFGASFRKTTFLWLRGLPPLFSTSISLHPIPFLDAGFRSSSSRSKTFPGVAAAMASQWGSL